MVVGDSDPATQQRISFEPFISRENLGTFCVGSTFQNERFSKTPNKAVYTFTILAGGGEDNKSKLVSHVCVFAQGIDHASARIKLHSDQCLRFWTLM